MAIPKILHQTGKTHSLPTGYQVLQQRLRQLHPTWEYRFYDDAACREFVRQQIPSLLPLYDQYPTHIQRIDVFRLVAVYVVGGFYLDLDIICHHRLDALRQHGAVFAEERTLSAAEAEALGHQDTRRVANYYVWQRSQASVLAACAPGDRDPVEAADYLRKRCLGVHRAGDAYDPLSSGEITIR